MHFKIYLPTSWNSSYFTCCNLFGKLTTLSNLQENSEVMTDEPPPSATNKEDPKPKNRQSRDRKKAVS